MSGLSEPTVGMLIEGGQIMRESDLRTLLMKAGIYYRETHEDNKPHLIRWRLLRARDQALDGDETAARGLLTFATELVQRTVPDPENPPPWFRALRDAFLADGYELTWDGEPPRIEVDLVTRLAEGHTGYQRTARASQGGAAITHVVQGGHLSADDGGAMLQGLWELTHTNGSHPGQSDADEARFRMQVITATSRFLLKRFPS